MDVEAVKAKLKHDARTGLAKHRFWLGVSCAVLPVTLVLFILPLLPNFLLYWNVWRIYSHNRAMNGAKRLNRIVHDYEATAQPQRQSSVPHVVEGTADAPTDADAAITTAATATATAAASSLSADAANNNNTANTTTTSSSNKAHRHRRHHQHDHDESSNSTNGKDTHQHQLIDQQQQQQHHHHRGPRIHVSLWPDDTLQVVWDGTRTTILTDQHIALLAGRLELSDDLLKRARIQVTKDQQQQQQQHHAKHPNYKQ